MSRAWLRQWERTRAKGKFRYIILYTLAITATGIFYSIFGFIAGAYDNFHDVMYGTLMHVVPLFFAGLLLSLFSWEYFERKYKKQRK